MGGKDPSDQGKSPLFRIDLSKEPKTGLRDFVRQRKEAQLAERERQKTEELARREAEALEAIPVKDHPLRKMPADFIDLYVKCVLILRAEMPLAYSDPEEEKKQLRLFAKSLGLSREHQRQLEQEVSRSSDQTKKETLLELASSRCDADGMTCLMCDMARLHGAGYLFEGDFADFWRDAACGIANLPDERLAAAEKLCRDIASGGKLASPEQYAPIAEALVTYFGQDAFAMGNCGTDGNGKYLVIDLSEGSNAEAYPFRWTDGDPDVSNDACRTTELWLRRIPAGTFTMGSPKRELRRSDNETQHNVTLTQDYFMGIFPVTQRQWKLVMGNNPSGCKKAGPGAPVEQVSYEDICGADRPWPASADVAVDSFLGRLRTKTGLPGFDLPTEAQWEYACRAGTLTALNSDKDLTSCKNVCPNLDEVGWYDENSRNTTHAVGKKRPNSWGLYDMHGNVLEWCRDWYDTYSGDAADPTGPASGSKRVNRGGGVCFIAESCRSAYRSYFDPCDWFFFLGFRLVFVPQR